MEDGKLNRPIIATTDEEEALYSVIQTWLRGGAVGTTRLRDGLIYALEHIEGPMVPSEEEIIEWLKTKRVAFWGDFMIVDENGYRQAAIWMRSQLVQMHEFLRGVRAR
jgi:hypothetical protein